MTHSYYISTSVTPATTDLGTITFDKAANATGDTLAINFDNVYLYNSRGGIRLNGRISDTVTENETPDERPPAADSIPGTVIPAGCMIQ